MPNTVVKGPTSWTIKPSALSTTLPAGPPPPPTIVSPPRGMVAALAAPAPGSEIAPIGLNVNTGEYVISVPDGVSAPMGNYTSKSIEGARKDLMERKKISNNYKSVMSEKASHQTVYNSKLSAAAKAELNRNEYKAYVQTIGAVPGKRGVNAKLATRKNFVSAFNKQAKLSAQAINATRKRCGWKKGVFGWTKPKVGQNGKYVLPPGVKKDECTTVTLNSLNKAAL